MDASRSATRSSSTASKNPLLPRSSVPHTERGTGSFPAVVCTSYGTTCRTDLEWARSSDFLLANENPYLVRNEVRPLLRTSYGTRYRTRYGLRPAEQHAAVVAAEAHRVRE